MNPKSISMIHKQLTTYFKVKYESILIGYYFFFFCYFIWWSPFIPSRNLDEVFTYNHIWL